MLQKIISGGQTGVDRGALDAALDAGFPCGGSCPRGRKAEDGAIAARYPLTEMATAEYRPRTRQNVMDADGTLILFWRELTGGTRETMLIAEELGKPLLTLDLATKPVEVAAVEAAAFVDLNSISTLNIAGPRESTRRGASEAARVLVAEMLRRVAAP
jgi:hypothetical protein